MKDLFSTGSQLYHQARPTYPSSIIEEILKHASERELAWDCGAGSGQFTQLLAPYFEQVVATDLSQQQLHQAPHFDNVSYQVQPAEKTSFMSQSFDVIAVAQAIHWFDFNKFYPEVYRCLKPDGLFAVIGYALIHVEPPELNQLIQTLYFETLNGYWDAERRYIDECYRTIPFPFKSISTPEYHMSYRWTGPQLLNYLSTWSGLKHYKQQRGTDPLIPIQHYLAAHQLDSHQSEIEVQFPILLRMGKRE
ncbi:methyltransferase family protein [Acinetobacter calcoaceticus]|uniref:Methyltransferase family protein n=1 Tax=Acinetobacter calcoaceticus TaxID=471 RepID=A0A4R1Y1J8_ACICA|nr:methyltransferase family protein [Acinetobacter calcoaceticus]